MKALITFTLLLISSLSGEDNRFKVGLGISPQYGSIGLQIATNKLDPDYDLFVTLAPLSPYITAIGVSSDLRFLRGTNFTAYLSFGTTGLQYASYGFSNCEESKEVCERKNVKHSIGLSTGIDYYFSEPEKGFHIGLNFKIWENYYYHDLQGLDFSSWEKGIPEKETPYFGLSLGYKW